MEPSVILVQLSEFLYHMNYGLLQQWLLKADDKPLQAFS